MDSSKRVSVRSAAIPHPGEIVTDYLESFDWSQSDLARRTGITPKTISEICNGKAPISPTTSLAFEKVFGRPAHFWLNLQRLYDEAEARQRESARSDQWKTWVSNFPLKEMKRLRFSLPETKNDVEAVLGFLGVSSPESWNSVWKAAEVTYRQTRKFEVSYEAVSAWVRETEIVASGLFTAEFDEQRLRSSLDELRALTRKPADEIMEPVQALCAQAGVAVVWVPELSHSGISGCARWLSDKRALVGLTLRFKSDDQMWFTLFHELGHILLHRKKHSFVLDNAADDLSDRVVDPEMQRCEAEANQFAADTLIPPAALDYLIKNNRFTSEAIYDFAEEINVAPGIVVGRLQFEGLLARHQGNAFKQKLNWRF